MRLTRVRVAAAALPPWVSAGSTAGIAPAVVARVIRFTGASQAIDEQQTRAYKRILPVLEALDGFRGLIFLGAPDREEALALTLWANEKAADASAETAQALRQATVEAGESVVGVEQFEVMLFEV